MYSYYECISICTTHIYCSTLFLFPYVLDNEKSYYYLGPLLTCSMYLRTGHSLSELFRGTITINQTMGFRSCCIILSSSLLSLWNVTRLEWLKIYVYIEELKESERVSVRERERGLLLVGIVFRGREIACLAAVPGPPSLPSCSARPPSLLTSNAH